MFFAERMKLVVEPTGCLGFAAVREMSVQLQGKRIGVLVSGEGDTTTHRLFCAGRSYRSRVFTQPHCFSCIAN
jgi:threo-3-hydroxy-L-aspartate ammonia-lyase